MKYVIMANGKGTRWNNFGGIPKHLIEIEGEPLLSRISRQISERDPSAQIIVSSSDPRCVAPGATRITPQRNELEIDRFAPEFVDDQVCFLYGDTFYSDEAFDIIIQTPTEGILFFGNAKSIVAVKSSNKKDFLEHLSRIRELSLKGEIANGKAWQLYQSYAGLPLGDDKNTDTDIFILFTDETGDFNMPSDLAEFKNRQQ